MGSNEDEIFLTPYEAMRVLKMKRSTFYAYVKQGIIPAVRIGHFIRIRRENVVDLGLSMQDISKVG
jgi:excisionase family DNA binding protein